MKSIVAEIITRKGKIVSINPSDTLSISNEFNQYHFQNAFLYPGFIDTHGHIFGLGNKLKSLNLYNAQSEDQAIQEALNNQNLRDGWLLGRGWNHENWNVKLFPDKKKLDEAFPNIPVSFVRVDGHSLWVNSKALKLANIDRSTLDPIGGLIHRDIFGEPTGILIDEAMNLVSKLIPPPDDDYIEKTILESCYELAKNGITQVHDMDVPPDFIKIYKKLDKEKKLPIRIKSFITAQNDELKRYSLERYQGNFFSVDGLKFYMDGALGSYGAALLEPYSDRPNENGIMLFDYSEFYSIVADGLDRGFNIATHAIGDRANRQCLQAYTGIIKEKSIDTKLKLRIEHAQIVHPDDLKYFESSAIAAAIQPIHCLSDAPMARKRLMDRCGYSYPWKSLLDITNNIGAGSDFPIESHNPLLGLYSLTSRKPFGELESWYPEEIINISDAIDLYTKFASKLTDSESISEIQVGCNADFAILDKDLNAITPDEILETKVLATFLDGKEIYNY